MSQELLSGEEKFALNTGKIAGKYVSFKREIGQDSNSLSTILTFSKYDKMSLFRVISLVCSGIRLAKVPSGKERLRDEMDEFAKKHYPKEDFASANASRDYAYFFHRGVYETLEVRGGDQG